MSKEKFARVIPKEEWSEEKTRTRISETKFEMNLMTMQITQLQKQIKNLKNNQQHIQNKVADKSKYLNQLISQLKNYKT